jgi:hypothetical protein
LTPAPLSSRMRQTSSRSLVASARSRVMPFPRSRLMSLPFSSNSLQTSAWPKGLEAKSGLAPFALAPLTLSPSWRRREHPSWWPFSAALYSILALWWFSTKNWLSS